MFERMADDGMVELLSWLMVVSGGVTAVLLQCFQAPYGRYTSAAWGPGVPAWLAWIIQELPSLLIPLHLAFFTPAIQLSHTPNVILLTMFIIHYIQRALIFPCLIRGGKSTPLIAFLLAVVFTTWNGYLQGYSLTYLNKYPQQWVSNPRFIFGILIFFLGMLINLHSDHILRNLRKPGETGYKIPTGGMFNYVSGANFFGEIIEWWGFALACWSFPALAFALFTSLNIGPRAIQHHKWYQEKFKEKYPKNRKALIPGIL